MSEAQEDGQMQDVPIEEQPVESTEDDGQKKRSCCAWYQFDGCTVAKGYCTLGGARGGLVMSNIFLATAFIYLASEEAGCLDEEGDVVEECDARVYGMSPAALVANIAVFSGVLSAFLMPFTGAIVDYTPYRRTVGISVALFIMIIQAAQIATMSQTWFAMAILQGISGFLYQIQVLATYAYLPDIARECGEDRTTGYQSIFTMAQFTGQAVFLLLPVAVGVAAKFQSDDVLTAQVSQGINVVWSGFFFFVGWRILPHAPAANVLPEGKKSLFLHSFSQVWTTVKHLNSHYKRSLRWYFLCLIFAEAGANAFTVVAVTYLNDQIGMSGIEIAIFFEITLICTIPGSVIGAKITRRTNPSISWRLSMVGLSIVAICGALLLTRGAKIESYIWGAFVGIMLGWFYPTENLAFSMLLPKGQEAELSGFYVYCTQILGWLPPLLFSIMVEADIHQKWGILAVQSFFFIAIIMLSFMAPWPEAVAETRDGVAAKGEALKRELMEEPEETNSLEKEAVPPEEPKILEKEISQAEVEA